MLKHALGRRFQFLDGIDPRHHMAILAAAKTRRIAARTVVSAQGTPADHLFVLTRGRVRFFYTTPDGQKLLLLWLAPGEVFGGAALLATPTTYLASTETVRDSSVLVWHRDTIRGLAERCPRLYDNMLLTCADYLRWAIVGHSAMISQTAEQRLADVLLVLADVIGRPVRGGVEVDVTNEELAGSAHITVFTTSRLLSRWQRDHTIAKRRGKLLLRARERLLAAAHGTPDSTLLPRNDLIHGGMPSSRGGSGQLVGGARTGGGR
jgi:CRP-like cAMP-binding protein